MQTQLADFLRGTPDGEEADEILRKCVHCGFCTATCPTYQLLGDELDGPRGRIYLIKQVLEGARPSARTRLHLDRCLTCRSCETTCPSGVRYGRLVDIGRGIVERSAERGLLERAQRATLGAVLPRGALFGALLKLGQAVRPVLPAPLKRAVPERARARGAWPAPRHTRRMLVLAGCVQPALAPVINAAAARVLDAAGVTLVEAPAAGCCGAVRFHLNAQQAGLDDMRALIDAWWPTIERGDAEAIVVTASGCGATVREFGHLLRGDPAYRDKAARVSAMTRDLSEVVRDNADALDARLASGRPNVHGRVAFHAPCTLQHALQLHGVVEALLASAGFELAPVADAHLCCGSAGTYSILQPRLANALRERKQAALHAGRPDTIVTANIGCLMHLQIGAQVPVRHWIELLDECLAPPVAGAAGVH
jgi:glycolate oxidase iron-sulfur subunit